MKTVCYVERCLTRDYVYYRGWPMCTFMFILDSIINSFEQTFRMLAYLTLSRYIVNGGLAKCDFQLLIISSLKSIVH